MDEPLIMVSPLRPEAALRRLAVFGKEWRESKIPVELRSAGIHTCRIVVENERFQLRFNQPRRAPSLIWIGRVSPSDEGSRIDASWEPTRASRLTNLASLAVVAVLWGWPAVRVGVWWVWVPLLGMALMSGLIAVQAALTSRRERNMCAAILAHVAEASVYAAAPEQPER